MTFPETNAELRTDIAFNEMSDALQHLGPSPFRNVAVGMVSQFPIDFVHLVCLGVVKRLINLWMKGPLINLCRQGVGTLKRISDGLSRVKKYMPREFTRKGRSLNEVERWKATEFRQFLLYTGPVVLKGHLPPEMYKHFLLLFVSIFCLCCNVFCTTYNEYGMPTS